MMEFKTHCQVSGNSWFTVSSQVKIYKRMQTPTDKENDLTYQLLPNKLSIFCKQPGNMRGKN